MIKIVSTILVGLVSFGAWYVYSDSKFERTKPLINTQSIVYFSNTRPLNIEISDNIGVKSYEVVAKPSNLLLAKKELPSGVKKENVSIKLPSSIVSKNGTNITISAKDTSKWNFFMGNHETKDFKLVIDNVAPLVEVVANSYGVTQGGSALVVFKATDNNMKSIYIQTPYGKFLPTPYKKAGYYASLISWPFDKDMFTANIIAEDKAGNKATINIPLYLKNKKYAISNIQATDTLIDGKILALASVDHRFDKMTKLEKFAGVNEGIRAENEHIIASLGAVVQNNMISDWKISPFYPLKNGAKVASYGDLRHYYYDTKTKAIISTSDHVGIDLASNKEAPLIVSNAGKVVFGGDNGIYGNMPMVDHGLGLYTLYGHCSKILKPKGSIVKAGDVIANSGTSGLALGDHLHFGVLVQGNEVAPEEWMDSNWIKLNIDDVFAKANMLIK